MQLLCWFTILIALFLSSICISVSNVKFFWIQFWFIILIELFGPFLFCSVLLIFLIGKIICLDWTCLLWFQSWPGGIKIIIAIAIKKGGHRCNSITNGLTHIVSGLHTSEYWSLIPAYHTVLMNDAPLVQELARILLPTATGDERTWLLPLQATASAALDLELVDVGEQSQRPTARTEWGMRLVLFLVMLLGPSLHWIRY